MWTAIFGFLTSAIGKYVAIGGVVLLAFGGTYLKGRNDGNAACVAKNEAQTKEAVDYVKKLRDRIERGQSDVPDSELLNADPYRRD